MPFDLDRYLIRRKVLKILGASFHVYDAQQRVVGFCSQKAFTLKEDIRVFTDESMSTELLAIQARQIIDFSAAYDVLDGRERHKIGALRRKGWSSLVRDSWELLDAGDSPIASLREDSTALALLRRFLGNLIPQRYHIAALAGQRLADLRVHFNPFVYMLEVERRGDPVLDPRMLLATGVLLAAIEGRQG